MCIHIARQRLCKYIPARANARKNRTSIAWQRISKHASITIEAVFSVRSVQSGYKEVLGSIESSRVEWRVEFREASLPGHEFSWQLQNNGKKWIGLRKEDFMCDLKWHWDCYKSVAWIRLVKAENPSACAAVNCEVCRSAVAPYYL
jgi:hypothetical protein